MLGWLRARRASRLARSGQQSQACPHPFEEGRELLEAIASLHAATHQVGLQSWRGLENESKRVFQEVEMFFARSVARAGSVRTDTARVPYREWSKRHRSRQF